jgi:hypothetical protein
MPRNLSHEPHTSWYANHLNNAIRGIGFLALVVIAVMIYRYLFDDIITGKSYFFAYIAIWVFTAYIILPRLYRVISRLYLPNYFFGRTQTGDGLLGDPINLAFNATTDQLKAAMKTAGWTESAPLNFRSSAKITYAAIRGSTYPDAPVSALFLFHRMQDFAFEKDIDGNPRQRHHIRFWKTPEKWWLPGGYQADWLAAATFDTNVSVSLFTGQITHKIDANVDHERDYVLDSLGKSNVITQMNTIEHFTSSYHSRNGGGDLIHTDGALPFVTLTTR